MQIMTSYFYQVRFMKPNMIPLSTALSDPQWFHKGTYDKTIQFKDKNGVWNGLRAEPFVPGEDCNGLCGGRPCDRSPDLCLFLKTYEYQLNQLNYQEIWNRFNVLSKNIQQLEGFKEEPICILLVHEAYTNPCSERWIIQKYFKKHGYNIKEFRFQ